MSSSEVKSITLENDNDKNLNFEVRYMAKKVDIIPLILLLGGAYLLSQNNPYGWFLVLLGIYVLLAKR
ncbi:MAG: hypothetical protein ABIJ10_05750 [Candidatus Micrarchaeota archaeon]